MKRLLQRPLCLLAVSYAVLVFLLQICELSPRDGAAADQSTVASLQRNTQVALTGQLYKKELKNDRLIFYLKQIQIIEVTQSDKISDLELNKEAHPPGVLCYMASGSESGASIGQWLYVCGQVMPFEAAQNEGQFDTKAYYEGLGFSMQLWDTAILAQGKEYDVLGDAVVDIKLNLSMRFQSYMKPENAGVLSAMLLGDKTSMDAEVKNLYRKTGIAHVLAISGLHISLLGMMMYRFLRRAYLPPPLCSLMGIGFVVVYIKVVGFGVSSFRAVCMFILFMMADLLERTYDLLSALACSALLAMIDNASVIFEAGFLLSYFAVLGLAIVLPVLKEQVEGIACLAKQSGPPVVSFFQKALRKLLLALFPGFAVQVFIFPITLWFYYEFPMYSFLLNLIIVPCMSVVLVSGIVGIFPGCGRVLYLTDSLLGCYEWLCRLTESFPGTVIVTGRPEVWQVVLYYVLVIVWLVAQARRRGKRGQAVQRLLHMVFPLLCMLLFLLPVHWEDRVDMLSVGQGDCVIMRDSTGRVVMVDGGSTDVSEVGRYRVVPFLKYHGISQLDAVFLSHAHEDHYSAVVEILESAGKNGVRIKTLCLGSYAASSAARSYAQLVTLAKAVGCEVVYLNPGDRITCGEMEFVNIYPPQDISVADENDTSVILLASLSDFTMLFTGDSSSACDVEAIRRLRALEIEEIDCLKVAHHGAKTSTGEELLAAFDFKLALISCGEGNSYGHPHKELLSRLRNAGCRTFVTANSGQITVRIRNGSLQIANETA